MVALVQNNFNELLTQQTVLKNTFADNISNQCKLIYITVTKIGKESFKITDLQHASKTLRNNLKCLQYQTKTENEIQVWRIFDKIVKKFENSINDLVDGKMVNLCVYFEGEAKKSKSSWRNLFKKQEEPYFFLYRYFYSVSNTFHLSKELSLGNNIGTIDTLDQYNFKLVDWDHIPDKFKSSASLHKTYYFT